MQERDVLGLLENIEMIVENQGWRFDSLSIQCCQNSWMKFVVIEVLAFPDIWTDNESGFGDLGVRYLPE